MKYFLVLLLAMGGPAWQLLTRVHTRNVAVATGTAAYARGDAALAAAAFAQALAAQAQRVPDPRLLLNMAHAQVRAGQLAPARVAYGRLLTGSSSTSIGSVARQQLAVLAAQQGQVAQALSLLRQALLLDPNNGGARFNYEVLSEYLAQRPSGPRIPPPAAGPKPNAPKPPPDKSGAAPNQPATKAGNDRPGETNDAKPSGAPTAPPEAQPDQAGRPDNRQPSALPGSAAGKRIPGTGAPQPTASGEAPGAQRGLDRSAAAAPAGNGRSKRPGTDAAAPGDLNLQTQRDRLEAMNLSPAQARQLLETLRAQEQQYLQQLTRPAQQKPDPSKPTW